MQTLQIKKTKNILRNKKELEKKLKVKINVKTDQVSFNGDELDEYTAGQVLQAIDLNFPLESALLLTEEDYVLEKINIKDLTKTKDLSRIRARIIGKQGKTLETLRTLSDCDITLIDNTVNIIARAEEIKEIINALQSLIHGAKQSNVYSYLEKARKRGKRSI